MVKDGVVYCPHCKEVLLTEITNNEWYDNCYVDSVTGECPQCGKVYSWEEVYRFVDVVNFNEEVPES